MTEPTELLPCPFCGGEAEEATSKGPTGERYRWAQCTDCGAMSECCDDSARHNNPEEPEPIDLWNTRTAHSGEGRSTFDPMQADKAVTRDMVRQTEALNNRPEIQVGRSNGAGEDAIRNAAEEIAQIITPGNFWNARTIGDLTGWCSRLQDRARGLSALAQPEGAKSD